MYRSCLGVVEHLGEHAGGVVHGLLPALGYGLGVDLPALLDLAGEAGGVVRQVRHRVVGWTSHIR